MSNNREAPMTANDREAQLERLLSARFARSAPIEEQLAQIGIGKRDLPTREECAEWAVKLGVPDEARLSNPPVKPPVGADDLVRRLRRISETYSLRSDERGHIAGLCGDAADTITRLERELMEARAETSCRIIDLAKAGKELARLRAEAECKLNVLATECERLANTCRELREAVEKKDAEIGRFKQALEDVVNPLQAMQRSADADGSRLNGFAYTLSNDVNHVKSIARAALQASNHGSVQSSPPEREG